MLKAMLQLTRNNHRTSAEEGGSWLKQDYCSVNLDSKWDANPKIIKKENPKNAVSILSVEKYTLSAF